jgi:hypothetical protein
MFFLEDLPGLLIKQRQRHILSTCGKQHAGKVAPATAQPVDDELADEDRGHLCEGQQGKVEEHAAGQVHRIQL